MYANSTTDLFLLIGGLCYQMPGKLYELKLNKLCVFDVV